MYEVFFNDRKIIITSEMNEGFNKKVTFIQMPVNEKDIKEWFFEFISGNLKDAIFVYQNPDDFFNRFQDSFCQLPAAGGVVKRKNHILFIFRNGKWDLPKGKIDNDEIPMDAALREVAEECGINGHHIIRELPSSFHIYQSTFKKNEGQWIFKKTSWFEMEYSGTNDGIPEQEEGIDKLKWFEREELGEVWGNTYENLKNVIRPYLF